MMPDSERPVRDMMLRTMKNLEVIDAFVKANAGQEHVYEVTQLVNSFLAALAHPWEKHKKQLRKISLQEARDAGWPALHADPITAEPKNLGDLLRLVRNALAHGNIKFLGNDQDDITHVQLWNTCGCGTRTWGTTVSVSDMRTFLDRFVDLAETFPEPEEVPNQRQATLETDCKHIAPSDELFTARMRFHQSWYRRHVLDLPPGPNPNAAGALYGNMLCEQDGAAGWNFVTGAIHTYAEERLANDPTHIEPHRLRNNLLSSQPLCFNLFAPLALELNLATRLVKALPGFAHITRVTAVKLEYAPSPKQNYLNDGTSFDAWIEYERADQTLGFVGIETKLTEPFSNAKYPFHGGYSKWMANGDWWWQPGAEGAFSNTAYNQLWRNHLLAFALRYQPSSKYTECYSAVVSHPLDNACPAAIAAYAEHLVPSGRQTLLSWPLDTLLNAWQPVAATRDEQFWLQSLRLRYLDLDASEASWRQRPDMEQAVP